MSWFREAGATWRRRASISVDNTAGAGGAIDASGAIPAAFDEFWDEIDATGNELRVVDADGVTKLAYSVASFNKTNRTGTLEIDGYSAPAAGMLQVFLYWNASWAATGAVVTTIAAAKSLVIETCGPATLDLVTAAPLRPGDTRPRRALGKASDETRDVWIDMAAWLPRRRMPFVGRYECDEMDYATYVLTTGDTAQASMVDATKTRYYGGRFVRVRVAAGTDGTDYTITPTIRTIEGLILTPRTWLKVRNQDEA